MTVNVIKATHMCCGESHKYRYVIICMDNTSFPKGTNFEYWRLH
jgi:hypothetical protein